MAALGLITSMLGFTDPMQQLIIALHFSQDSFGTATNVTGDQAIALIVDKFDCSAKPKAADRGGGKEYPVWRYFSILSVSLTTAFW